MKKADFNRILFTVSRHNVLPLTSGCNFDCAFCSHKQNPPGLEVFTLPNLSAEDYRELIDYLDPGRKIVIGESSTRIIEGEPLCRKDALSILGMVRERFPYTPITITTNGSLLDREKVEKLRELMPVEVNLSINYITPDVRAKFLGINDGTGIMDTVKLLNEHRVPYNGSTVAMEFESWEIEIEKVLLFLEANGARTLRIFYPGYTKFCPDSCCKISYRHLSETVERLAQGSELPVILEPPLITDFNAVVDGVIRESPAFISGIKKGDRIIAVDGNKVLSRVDAFNRILKASEPVIEIMRCGRRFFIRLDKGGRNSSGLVFKYDIDPGQMERVMQAVKSRRATAPLVVTSGMAFDRIKGYFEGRNSNIKVVRVNNRYFGGNINCAGLMVVEDIVSSLIDSPVGEADLILLPSIAFDHRGRDLTGRSFREIEKITGIPAEVI